MAGQAADLLKLPLESLEQVLQWAGPVERGQAAMACQQLRKAAEATVLEDVTITLHAENVSALAHWLQVHGKKVSKLHIQAPSLHSACSKAEIWDALSTPAAVTRLNHLYLDMPLTSCDETAVIGRVCASAAKLTSLHLNYQRPISHSHKINVMCFCAHVNGALWATAQQLRALRITGACLCNTSSITHLSGLTALQLSCCNSAAEDAGLAQLLRTLCNLQELHYTTSKQAVITGEAVAALAGHGSLKHLELHNFAVPKFNLAGQLESNAAVFAAIAGISSAATAGNVSAASAVVLGAALRRLQVVRLVDCVGVTKLLPHLAASAGGKPLQLQHLGVTHSRQHGFMPSVLAGLLSDSDSDSDSDDSDSASDSEDSNSSDCDSDDSSCERNGSGAEDSACGSELTGCCSTSHGAATSGTCCPRGTCMPAEPVAAKVVAKDLLHLQAFKPVSNCCSISRSSSSGKVSNARAKLLRGIAPIAMLHTLTELDLSGLGLHSISPLCSLGNITTLKLGPAAGAVGLNHYVNRLSHEGLVGIEMLEQLQHLDLSHNQLSWDSIGLLQTLANLTHLSLAGNNLGSQSNRCGSCLDSSQAEFHGARQSSHSAWMSVGNAVQCLRANSVGSNSIACSGSRDGCSSSELAPLTTPAQSELQLGATDDGCGNTEASSRMFTRSSSSCSNNGRAGTAANCCGKVGGVCLVWVLPRRLRHLDVSGCSLSSVPGLSDLTHLTSLKAGTGLRYMGRGVWVTAANQLSPSTVANIATLAALQDLELAADVPAQCYSRFTALTQLTRLVAQDFNAAEGLFGLAVPSWEGSRSSTTSSTAARCSFPHLVELGVMLQSPHSAAAMQHLPQSCRALKRLSVYQDSTTAATAAQFGSSSSGSWHVPCLSGLTGLTRLDVQPPADLRLLSGLSRLRHLQLLGSGETCKPGDLAGGADTKRAAGCCGPDALAGGGCGPEASPGCCGPDALPGCRETAHAQPAAAVPAAPYGSLCRRLAELSGMYPAARVVADDELLGLAGLTSLSQLELQHVCVDRKAVDQLQLLLPCTRIAI